MLSAQMNKMNSNSNTDSTKKIVQELLLPTFIPSTITCENDILPGLKKLSTYLSSLKSFPSDEQKHKLTAHFITISLHNFFSLGQSLSIELQSTLLCAFVDIMRLYVPELAFEQQTMIFYLSNILQYILAYDPLHESSQNEIKLEYIIDRLSRSNLLSLLISSEMEDQIPLLIHSFLKLQEIKGYMEHQETFMNIVSIITGVLEELSVAPYIILIDLLKNFNKKKSETKFKLCQEILIKVKNTFSGPINELIVSIEDKEIKKFSPEEYTTIIKNLSQISKEYIIRFFSTIPFKDKKFFSLSVNNAKYWKILLKIFSQPNSIDIAKTYTDLFMVIVEKITNINNIASGMKIFKCLVKFISRNIKEELKQANFYFVIFEKIRLYVKEIKDGENAIKILQIIEKVSNWKIIKLVTINLLDSPNEDIQIECLKYLFQEFFNKKIFSNFSVYDFNSIDRLKYLSKLSSLFYSVIHKVKRNDNEYNKQLIQIFYSLLHQENGVIILVILFYFSMTNESTSPNTLWNQIILGSYDELSICLLQIKESTEINKEDFIKGNVDFYDETNFYYKHQKALMFSFTNGKTVASIVEFFHSYLNLIDENSNINQIKIVNSIMFVLIYYVKYIEVMKNTFDIQSIMDQLTTIENVLQIIKLIFANKINNKTVISTVMILIKQLLDLNIDEKLQEDLKEFILKELSDYCLEQRDSPIKSLAVIIYELNNNLYKTNISLPVSFGELLEKENLINPLKFINEILKLDNNGKFNEIFFAEKIRTFFLVDIKEKLKKIIKKGNKSLNKGSDSELKNEMMKHTITYHEILKYNFYYVFKMHKFKDSYFRDMNKFMKEILLSISLIIDKQINKDIKNDDNDDSKSNDSNQSNEDNKKKEKLSDIASIRLLTIIKHINLLFNWYDKDIPIKPSNQMRFTNIALSNFIIIRKHFINKIQKKITQKGAINSYINIIPILTLFFNDTNKYLQKKGKQIISSFVSLLLSRLDQFNNNHTESNYISSSYRFIPEIYLSYIIVYFIFNANLNILFQMNEKKFFSDIVTAFLRIIKKESNNQYDSDLLLKMMNKMKEEKIGKYKKITGFFTQDLVFDIDEYSYDKINYEDVKNGVIELIQGIITKGFTNNFRREGVKPKLPVIFLGDKTKNRFDEANLALNISKTFVLDTTKIIGSADPKRKSPSKKVDNIDNPSFNDFSTIKKEKI